MRKNYLDDHATGSAVLVAADAYNYAARTADTTVHLSGGMVLTNTGGASEAELGAFVESARLKQPEAVRHAA